MIVPLFALANAGVARCTADIARGGGDLPVTLGVVAGLVLGKLVGILLGAVAARRLGRLRPG